jgi:hypothetical protein
MGKLSKDHLRSTCLVLRLSESEKAIIRKLAEKSKAKTLSSYIRAMALNRPVEGRAVFYKILDEQIRMNAQIEAAHDCQAKEQAMAAAEDFMLWVMEQK